MIQPKPIQEWVVQYERISPDGTKTEWTLTVRGDTPEEAERGAERFESDMNLHSAYEFERISGPTTKSSD